MKKLSDINNTVVAVVGGGNVGTQFACISASRGYKVRILCSKPQNFADTLEIVDENDNVTSGSPELVSSDLSAVITGADVIIVTYPAFMLEELGRQMLPFVHEGQVIIMMPGTGGAEFAFHDLIRKGVILSGVQRVPSVARLEEYGKRVRCEGLRREMFLASIPRANAASICEFIEFLFGITCTALPNYLCVTLTPSNPILHTTRLRTLFADYKEGVIYDHNPLFYGDWSDESSSLLLKCDEELQTICRTLNKADLSSVKSLKIHYENDTVEGLTAKMRSIESLHNLGSPMVKKGDGFIPDFNSRYFKADFPYGLAIIKSFADVLGIDVPNVDDTLNWYRTLTGDETKLTLEEHDIFTADDIYDFYHF